MENSVLIVPFTIDKLNDVINFENNLREEEDVWGWDIDDKYISSVKV